MKNRRKFTAEFKAQVVLEVLTGVKSTAEACREHQLHAQQLGQWKRQFLQQAPTLFANGQPNDEAEQRIAELEGLVGRLTMELEIAKKASNILNSRLGRNER